MTSKSMSCRETQSCGADGKFRPILLLSPVGKDYLWGGNRLREEYGKDLPGNELPWSPLAETWECSTHPDGPSVVAEVAGVEECEGAGRAERGCTEDGSRIGAHGEALRGRGLDEVLGMYPEWLGSRYYPGGWRGSAFPGDVAPELPILIKFIDAAKDLSVQVHPDDEYALVHENQMGKTEMWYVLDAEPGAKLVYGFAHDVTREQVLESLRNGTVMDYLQQIPVHKNDVFFVQPGTVHAIGGGVLVAEIQENSNVTYRVYDYDRVDKDGCKRPLHVEKALDVLNYKRADEPRQQMRLMRYQPGSASEILCRCPYFQVDRVLVNGEYRMRVEDISFQVLLVLEGDLIIGKSTDVAGENAYREAASTAEGSLVAEKGACVFLPAGCGEITVRGKGQLLQVFG